MIVVLFVLQPLDGSKHPLYCWSDYNLPKKKLPVQQLGIIMPTAVIMEENFDKLLDQCETQELEVSIGKQNAYFFSCHG